MGLSPFVMGLSGSSVHWSGSWLECGLYVIMSPQSSMRRVKHADARLKSCQKYSRRVRGKISKIYRQKRTYDVSSPKKCNSGTLGSGEAIHVSCTVISPSHTIWVSGIHVSVICGGWENYINYRLPLLWYPQLKKHISTIFSSSTLLSKNDNSKVIALAHTKWCCNFRISLLT